MGDVLESSSSGETSVDGGRSKIQFIDAETEESEGSVGGSNQFFNCESPKSDQLFLPEESSVEEDSLPPLIVDNVNVKDRESVQKT